MKNKSLTPHIRFKGYNDEWKESTIEEHFTLYSGTTPSRSIPNAFCGSINWISSGELKPHYIGETKEKITEEVFRNSSLRLLPPGLLVIAIYGLEAAGVRGTASVTSVPTTISQACTAFIPNPRGEVDVEFLYGWYKHNGNYIGTHFAQGTKQQNLKSEIINELSVSYPKGEEQKQIGNLLRNLDSLIDEAESEIARLEKIKQASLQKMFPRPGETTPEIRFEGYSRPWIIGSLYDLLEIDNTRNSNNIYGREDVLSVSGEYGLVNQIEFQGRSFAGASLKGYKITTEGQVIYTKSPLKLQPYGIVKSNQYGIGLLSPLYAVYNPKSNVHADFIHYYFAPIARLNNYLRPLINKGAKNTLLISDETALMGDVCYPEDTTEQERIAAFFRNLDALIFAKRQKIEKLQNLKQSCLDKMFINTTAQ